ncbi:putative tRNA guanylyltransferase [Blastocystis sp. subtype 4]|uniref:putative tRNA guanylyltransferase n=1 Tax=Blastocystis sp. subtype 4 TaxID=944170 RepID=UPI0007116F51|nr:putative tRNA guanylyltransferase [Blastocystis sp. subtype 4]KNB45302.1 putative tRNA guanylyltransferase [Blastocystis sp. subtype 4]|eukprot:XP_014528745.1 putative tRNA guanylyltransferase [Blastocystis sp. subtype 4]
MSVPLQYPPSFDGRVIIYPTLQNIRDYISWRQADTHINNLYNTAFWALVLQGGKSTTDAEKILNGSLSSDKNELLFTQFGINYNNESEMFKKGSIIIREKRDLILRRLEKQPNTISTSLTKEEVMSMSENSYETVVLHCDVIRDKPFWTDHPELLD